MSKAYGNIIKIAGIALAVYLGMRYLLPVALPFLIAWLFVRLVLPASRWLQKKLHIKKELSGMLMLGLVGAALGIVLYLIGSTLIGQICNLAAHMDIYLAGAERFVSECCRCVERSTGIHAQTVERFIYDNIEILETRVRTYAVPGMLKNSISYMMLMLKWLGAALVIFVAAALMLKDYDEIREKAAEYPFFLHVRKIVSSMQSFGGAWLRAQLLILFLVTVICVAGLWLLRYPYALLMGIVIGLLDTLPFIGTGTVLVPWGAYLMFTGEFAYGVCLLVIFMVANTLREYLEPKLIGDRIGVYPIVMVAAVYAGLYVYGVSGVVLGPVSLILIVEIYREYI